ncbi:Glutaredoxin domain protein [Luminiphilus syltensis NOR5-1B]|uniref:Glutaredoxin domain protein n=1 Tax=Luminiphilus syltensis NOR5-1B TaxID=565045 RepID=B8KRP8_9GAMM|nr:glutaredoxin domain-containing protein [Luminiphilus syltensis]EED36347.1 Glutaredoxin domain protein [Luminiphilus syltensis NOR5-1B]
MTADYRVYWAPGCSSCLRTKEFLLDHGIPFESVNIVEDPDALDELADIGFRTVPVVRRGDAAVFCQDLQDVADFVGVSLKKSELSAADLVGKCDLLMLAAQRYLRQLSEEQLAGHFPGRDRTYRDLGYHIFMVIQGFLEAAEGGSLEMEAFLRMPPEDVVTSEHLAAVGEEVRSTLSDWWEGVNHQPPETVKTYYGVRATFSVLERTTWHAAQHCRQLEAVVKSHGMAPDGALGDAELGGLPLPKNIYDNEIAMDSEAVDTRPFPLKHSDPA